MIYTYMLIRIDVYMQHSDDMDKIVLMYLYHTNISRLEHPPMCESNLQTGLYGHRLGCWRSFDFSVALG